MTEVFIGELEHLGDLPRKIEIEGRSYYLIKDHDKFNLLSTECPHQGGTILFENETGCFKCPLHQWSFDETGQSLNIKGLKMHSYPVKNHNGNLYVKVNTIKGNSNIKVEHEKVSKRPKLRLHAHACLEIQSENFNLLCDPWLEGPAFIGAWIHSPPAASVVADLNPDAIWISHEHSDHFHEPTLRKFNKFIPVYVPDFPNRRMVLKLKELGFKNIYAVPFGKKVNLAENFSITIYEPASLWNDAFVLIEVNDFRILNLNDTGINRRIAEIIGSVDVVASSFSPGASGYPSTWKHLSTEKKKQIMLSSKKGMLEMLMLAMETYKARYLLPFASYFTLWRPEHEDYRVNLQKNTLDDVKRYFENTPYKVVPILPGDQWDAEQDKIEIGHELPNTEEYIQKNREHVQFNHFHPYPATNLTVQSLENYFLNLNNVPEIVFCEDLTCTVRTFNEVSLTIHFRIKKGQLNIISELENRPNLVMEIPANIMQWLIENNESWDEATIGYWCKFERYPDEYHADFWRLLQAPYYKKDNSNKNPFYTHTTSIAEVIENKGKEAERIFGRYGLYCTGCQNSIYESIQQGAKSHGLNEFQTSKLIKELNAL